MTPRDWIENTDWPKADGPFSDGPFEGPFPGLHGSIPVTGYVHHASRVERTLGWILWIGLAVVLVAGSI